MRFATKELIENYPDFETQFTAFFEDLKEHIIRFIKTGRFLLKSY
jgi:hypothetical protein